MPGLIPKPTMAENQDRGLPTLPPMTSSLSSSSLGSAGSQKSAINSMVSEEGWRSDGLAVIVIGASGDLAKKKTYPSLLDLFHDGFLPEDTVIWGYARSPMTHDALRAKIKPFLVQGRQYSEETINSFLECCFYKSGSSYADHDAFTTMVQYVSEHERSFPRKPAHNRLFYLAVPPNVFGETGLTIKKTAMQDSDKGWSRLIIEKPFGRDLESCEVLTKTLAAQFDEHHLYRIDHYLGKEVVQNLLVLRFGNAWFEWMWNRNAVQSVTISFKEPFGTEGRGGYFDNYGIIRDVLQNHLLQVLTLVAMEPPVEFDGPNAGDHIRDAKVQVLKAMPIITLDDCLLGQYDGYADDPTIEKEDTNTPTYAALRCFVNTPRWSGVPFILEAGKALNERKCEVRIQFRPAPAAFGPPGVTAREMPRNELVMRLQPDPAIYMKTNVKSPGFASTPTPISLGMDYGTQFDNEYSNPDAYTRLILDVLRGRQGSFVRDDELRKSWEIFTPLLHTIERDNVRPDMYKYGTAGPSGKDAFMERMGAYVDTNKDADTPYVRRAGHAVRQSSL